MEDWSARIRDELANARRTLRMAEPFVRLETAARSSGYLSIVTGWIPAGEIRRTQDALAASLAR